MNAVGRPYRLPPEKQQILRRAVRTEWAFIAFLLSIIVLMAAVMSSSQTMKALWVEDTLSLIPCVSFLVGAHYRTKEPNEAYPYGYRRAVLMGFLCGAVTLFGFGALIFGDSVAELLAAKHPSIPTVQVLHVRIWLGWLMVAALIYSSIPPLVFGRLKTRLARELHDKTLHVSAELNRGDWMSGVAGLVGIVGIAYGYWWADSAAAAFISLDIIRDGYTNLRNSVAQLMNKRPTDIETKKEDPVIDKLQSAIDALDWVAHSRVRLREDGDVLTGEVFLEPADEHNLLDRLDQARHVAEKLDWRLHDISIVPVHSVD